MKKGYGNILYAILIGLLMVFLFSFMIQEHLKPFKTKELMGYFMKPNKPNFRWEWYKNGYFQQSIENFPEITGEGIQNGKIKLPETNTLSKDNALFPTFAE